MEINNIPMVENRKALMPKVYGDTPSFLGSEVVNGKGMDSRYDVIFAGVPWEGTITWGAGTGCELAPRSIRHASARYGGFLPEYGINIFDYLKLGDVGDVPVNINSPRETMDNVFKQMDEIYKNKSIPFVLGGDHSFTPEIVRAISGNKSEKVGVIHFDSHFDNLPSFGADKFPRCGPIHRIANLDNVDGRNIVQIGIRGPRNSAIQQRYADEMGAKVYTIRDVQALGIETVIEEAIRIAREGTECFYVTICSDCIGAAFNPGGPADFNGMSPGELFSALYLLGEAGMAGMDFVEVYPNQDPNSISSHLASWAIIHALAGLASRRKSNLDLMG
jgi:guanidinopropionase